MRAAALLPLVAAAFVLVGQAPRRRARGCPAGMTLIERAYCIEDRLARDVLGGDHRLEARLLGDDATLLAQQRCARCVQVERDDAAAREIAGDAFTR